MKSSANIWALVPAAGAGSRMAAAVPKQYLPLAGKTVLEITLGKMLSLPMLRGVIVAVAERDEHFSEYRSA